jgi:hypothetical protein
MCSAEAGFDTGSNCKGYSSRDTNLFEDKLAPCQGKKTCVFHGLEDVVPIGTSYPDGDECKITATSTFFVQYDCKVGDAEIELKRF